MKSTGIVRKVDERGRIVLPNELRNALGIEIKDPIEIFVDEKTIILKKYEPECMFCNNVLNVTLFNGKNICFECLQEFSK